MSYGKDLTGDSALTFGKDCFQKDAEGGLTR